MEDASEGLSLLISETAKLSCGEDSLELEPSQIFDNLKVDPFVKKGEKIQSETYRKNPGKDRGDPVRNIPGKEDQIGDNQSGDMAVDKQQHVDTSIAELEKTERANLALKFARASEARVHSPSPKKSLVTGSDTRMGSPTSSSNYIAPHKRLHHNFCPKGQALKDKALKGCELFIKPSFHLPSRNFQQELQRIIHVPKAASSSSSSTMDAPPLGYRRNVGICLINSSRKIFTASRLYIPGSWQMPQGGADEGENPRNAAIRELREETGVTSAEIIAEVPYWLTYDFPPQVKAKINRRWGSDWKGQAQKWFLFKFTGKDKEINLLGDGSEKPEFGKWSWMSPEQVFEHAVHFKKPVYEQVLNVFSPYLVVDKDGGRSRQSGNQ